MIKWDLLFPDISCEPMMTETTVRLHWADCLLFAMSLVLSLGVGLYHGCMKKLHFNADEFFLGGRQLGIVPVAISLFVSWLSALSLLSEPVEVYYYGAGFWYVTVGYVLGLLPIAFYFAPRFHEMKFISMGEVCILYSSSFPSKHDPMTMGKD